MDRSEVVLVGMLFSPIAPLVNTMGLSILTGDVYMFLKGAVKSFLIAGVIIVVSAGISMALPFTGLPDQVASRMTPTVMDFALALLAGLITPVVLLRGSRLENLAITPILSILVFPPLVIVGYGLGAEVGKDLFGAIEGGGLLSFSANFTAMLIGVLVSQWILRLTQHKASAYIKAWKEKEIEEGELHKWFERLHLVRFLEFVGTPFARIFVLALLTAALFVPLSTTFVRVVQEYEASEVVEQLAFEAFEVENRSSILSADHIRQDSFLAVTVKVATTRYFNESDVTSFEEKVTRNLKIPVRLALIQSKGNLNFGAGITVEEGGDFLEADPSHVAHRMELVKASLQDAIQSLPVEEGLKVFAFGTEFGMDSLDMQVNLEYYAPEALTGYAENLMKLNISEKVGLPTGAIRMDWFPNQYFGEGTELAAFRDATGEIAPRYLMEKIESPELVVGLPQVDSMEAEQALWKREIRKINPAAEVTFDSSTTDQYSLRFQ